MPVTGKVSTKPGKESACGGRFSGSGHLSHGALAGRLHSPLQQQRRAALAYLLSGALGHSLLLVVAAAGGQQESRPLYGGTAVRQLMGDHCGVFDSIRAVSRERWITDRWSPRGLQPPGAPAGWPTRWCSGCALGL